MRAFYNMAQDDPEALQAMLDYARGELRRAAVKTDGTLDPAKLARFQKDHAAALEMLPRDADGSAAPEHSGPWTCRGGKAA